jgi:hypothetical protein
VAIYAIDIEAIIFSQAMTMASHALAHMRQCSSVCIMHSAEQALPIATQAIIIACMLIMSMPMGRIIMRIIVVATSAMFMHIDEHFAMSIPMSLSAHMVAAIAAAEHVSMHSCIIVMSMPIILSIGMDFIMSIIMLSIGGSP